jgi:hypothetical protein
VRRSFGSQTSAFFTNQPGRTSFNGLNSGRIRSWTNFFQQRRACRLDGQSTDRYLNANRYPNANLYGHVNPNLNRHADSHTYGHPPPNRHTDAHAITD